MESVKLQAMAASMFPPNLAKAAGHVMIGKDLAWWLKGMMNHLHKIRGICER